MSAKIRNFAQYKKLTNILSNGKQTRHTKGTRDFSPVEMAKRNYIFDTIKEVYALYGFRQIETPAMENLSTLMGKYGEEGDKLLFKILNSGDFLSGVTASGNRSPQYGPSGRRLCEKGLR